MDEAGTASRIRLRRPLDPWGQTWKGDLCHDRGMRRLIPAPLLDLSRDDDIDRLAAHYAYPADGSVRANMVASIDGAIGLDGRSKPISGHADWFLFGVQRALSDVIVVGAGTARAEGYGPGRARPEFAFLRTAAGQPEAPDPGARHGERAARRRRRRVLRKHEVDRDHLRDAAPGDRIEPLRAVADVIVSGADSVDLTGAVQVLRERGLVGSSPKAVPVCSARWRPTT